MRRSARFASATIETEDNCRTPGRCSTKMKWYSTDSLHTTCQLPQSPIHQSCEMNQINSIASHTKVAKKSAAKKQPKVVKRPQVKAESVHDLRRCAVSSLVKVPPQFTTLRPQRLPLQVEAILKEAAAKNQVIDVETSRQDRFFLANGTNPFGRFLKLAKSWTSRFDDPDNSELEENLPLEELDRPHNQVDNQKRVSL
jgi:hypothetical protein